MREQNNPSTPDSLQKLVDAGGHLVLCRPDKRPMWRGWQKRRPSADVSRVHLDGEYGPLGIIPWSLHSTALDVDEGDPSELFSWLPPWARIPSRRGEHGYFDDDAPRGNHSWRLGDLGGDIRSAKGFLVLHSDGAARLADALERRIYGRHKFPRDLFEMAGLEPVLADPVPAPVAAERVGLTADAPIQIALERVTKGGRGVALFNQVRWWAYAQSKGSTLSQWQRRVLQYANEQNERFRAPITAARVASTSWSIASWTWDGGGSIDHSPIAQTRRGIASGKVRRFLTYNRDVAIVARLDAGGSTREVARAFGVSQRTAAYARGRLTRQRREPLQGGENGGRNLGAKVAPPPR